LHLRIIETERHEERERARDWQRTVIKVLAEKHDNRSDGEPLVKQSIPRRRRERTKLWFCLRRSNEEHGRRNRGMRLVFRKTTASNEKTTSGKNRLEKRPAMTREGRFEVKIDIEERFEGR